MEQKEDELINKVRGVPKRKLSDVEKQLIFILVEKSKIERERSMSILNKGFLLFTLCLIIAYLSRTNNLLDQLYINLVVLLGIFIVIAAVILYESVIKKEKKTLDTLLESYIN